MDLVGAVSMWLPQRESGSLCVVFECGVGRRGLDVGGAYCLVWILAESMFMCLLACCVRACLCGHWLESDVCLMHLQWMHQGEHVPGQSVWAHFLHLVFWNVHWVAVWLYLRQLEHCLTCLMYGLTSSLVWAPKQMCLGASGNLAVFFKFTITIEVGTVLPFLFEVILRVLVIWG